MNETTKELIDRWIKKVDQEILNSNVTECGCTVTTCNPFFQEYVKTRRQCVVVEKQAVIVLGLANNDRLSITETWHLPFSHLPRVISRRLFSLWTRCHPVSALFPRLMHRACV